MVTTHNSSSLIPKHAQLSSQLQVNSQNLSPPVVLTPTVQGQNLTQALKESPLIAAAVIIAALAFTIFCILYYKKHKEKKITASPTPVPPNQNQVPNPNTPPRVTPRPGVTPTPSSPPQPTQPSRTPVKNVPLQVNNSISIPDSEQSTVIRQEISQWLDQRIRILRSVAIPITPGTYAFSINVSWSTSTKGFCEISQVNSPQEQEAFFTRAKNQLMSKLEPDLITTAPLISVEFFGWRKNATQRFDVALFTKNTIIRDTGLGSGAGAQSVSNQSLADLQPYLDNVPALKSKIEARIQG